jgi:uncharacterized protein (TIGR02996 family)
MAMITRDTSSAFEEAIREQPDDLTHRLIYADFLQDHDDPALVARGEFIRTQCALSQSSSTDPRRAELVRQQRELHDLYGRSWAGPLQSLVRSLEFRNGFVERVRLDASEFLRCAPRLFSLAPLREVELTDAGPCLPALTASPYLNRVTHLDLDGSRTNASQMIEFFACPRLSNLQSLRLRLLPVAALPALGGRSLRKLAHLDFSGNALGPDGMEHLVLEPTWPSLRSLVLTSCGLQSSGVEILSSASWLNQLTALDLRANNITALGALALARSPRCQRLEVLWLGFNLISDVGLSALAGSPWLLSLARLYLGSNGLQGPGVESLAQSPLLGRLTHLDLDYNDLSPASLERLLSSDHLEQLLTLYLRCGRGLGPRLRESFRQRLGDRVCWF